MNLLEMKIFFEKYLKICRLNEALNYALLLYENHKEIDEKIYWTCRKAEIYQKLGDTKNSLIYTDNALNMSYKNSNSTHLKLIYQTYCDICYGCKNYDNLFNLTQSNIYYDERRNFELLTSIKEKEDEELDSLEKKLKIINQNIEIKKKKINYLENEVKKADKIMQKILPDKNYEEIEKKNENENEKENKSELYNISKTNNKNFIYNNLEKNKINEESKNLEENKDDKINIYKNNNNNSEENNLDEENNHLDQNESDSRLENDKSFIKNDVIFLFIQQKELQELEELEEVKNILDKKIKDKKIINRENSLSKIKHYLFQNMMEEAKVEINNFEKLFCQNIKKSETNEDFSLFNYYLSILLREKTDYKGSIEKNTKSMKTSANIYGKFHLQHLDRLINFFLIYEKNKKILKATLYLTEIYKICLNLFENGEIVKRIFEKIQIKYSILEKLKSKKKGDIEIMRLSLAQITQSEAEINKARKKLQKVMNEQEKKAIKEKEIEKNKPISDQTFEERTLFFHLEKEIKYLKLLTKEEEFSLTEKVSKLNTFTKVKK